MFYECKGERFKSVLEEESGSWLISYDFPSCPVFVGPDSAIEYRKIETPKEYILRAENLKNKTKSEKNREKIIEELINNPVFIKNKKEKLKKVKEISKKQGVNARTVLRIYYRFLATGSVSVKKERAEKKVFEKEFKYAIRKYYFSAKKYSIRDTYEMMIFDLFVDKEGKIIKNYPSWNQFRYFFYKNQVNLSNKKEISRNGLSNYQRNFKPIQGKMKNWKNGLGYYQMDATEADIYLVSRKNRDKVIGRPKIYLAVDTLTEMITGIHLSLSETENDVMRCVVNSAGDKKKFCHQYGVEIREEDWPGSGIPKCIITDQGRDFTSTRIEELCKRYDTEIENLEPYRADRKGIVEKSFDLLQNLYKPMLRKKGIIEPDAAERWATDYRTQASLDMDEFMSVLIRCVVYLNSGRALKNYEPTEEMIRENIKLSPANLWLWYKKEGKDQTAPVDEEEFYRMSLPRSEASIGRRGILFKKFTYTNPNLSKILQRNPSKVTIAYDDMDISKIYMIENHEYIPFTRPGEEAFTRQESEIWETMKRENKKAYEKECLEEKISLLRNIKEIATEKSCVSSVDEESIKKNREDEKGVQG